MREPLYLRFDTCSTEDKKQAGRKCSMNGFDYVMKNKRHIWNFEHEVLNELKEFLQLFAIYSNSLTHEVQ
ncbi:hypothetical protein myaer87_03730 [Microcystis aeruginosa NIES-87]|nr:hypothetical protein myaer87_03730 [Microcystis aeruginosa NIES-87]